MAHPHGGRDPAPRDFDAPGAADRPGQTEREQTPSRASAGLSAESPRPADRRTDVRGLYVHIPLCLAKCAYCDFYSVPRIRADVDALLAALAREIETWADRLTRPLSSVFLGGGTPTVLSAGEIDTLGRHLSPWIGEETEVSIEANPATLTGEKLSACRRAGVNRVNIGLQALDDDLLATLARPHSAAEARQAVGEVRSAGFANVGVDLIYGVPGQTPAGWSATLDEALSLGIEHLSCYALSFEEGTPLTGRLERGELAELDEQMQRAMYEQAIARAVSAGMAHYEISNFARPGRRCRHNMLYWLNESYLGVGPAAASYVDGERWTNRPDVDGYIRAAEQGVPIPAERERLTGRARLAEALMVALRLVEGVDRSLFTARYGVDPVAAFPVATGRFLAMGALSEHAGRLFVTPAYRFVSDEILAEILAEA